MRKLTVLAALALAVLVAMPAASVEINSIKGHWPFSVAPATVKVMTYTTHVSNMHNLPVGVIAWSGDGSTLYTRDWTDISGTWAFAPFPLKIPGAKTLPAPGGDLTTVSDSVTVRVEIYCPADSAFALWAW